MSIRYIFQCVCWAPTYVPGTVLGIGEYSNEQNTQNICPCRGYILLIQTLHCQSGTIGALKIYKEWDGGSRVYDGESGHLKEKDKWKKRCGWAVH